jgi:hypothetical protein
LVSRNERLASGRSKLYSKGRGGSKKGEAGNYFSRVAKLLINQDLLFSSSLLFSPTVLFPSLILFSDEIQDMVRAD